MTGGFDPGAVGPDPETYLAAAEARVPGILPGAEKRIVRAASRGRTPLSVVYVHGFSATSAEIRPVPDAVARALRANLFFTRLTGHGQDGAALGRATLADWRADLAEALEIGRRIGDRVLVIATSTGASLALSAAFDPAANARLAGLVLVSPNFGVRQRLGFLPEWPGARWFLPLILGRERGFEPQDAEQARWWTTRYPTTALAPMAAAARAARRLPVANARLPALFLFDDGDRVVRADLTRRFAARWGRGATVAAVTPGPGDDPSRHVIAGDLLSPGMTDAVVARILAWVRATGLQDKADHDEGEAKARDAD